MGWLQSERYLEDLKFSGGQPSVIDRKKYTQRRQSGSTFVPYLAVLTVQIVTKTSVSLEYLLLKVMSAII